MLLGRNGAGKTTTLRTIMGLWNASRGNVTFDGRAIGGEKGRLATPDISQLGIAYVPENMGIFSDLSVRENLLLAARNARSIDDIDTPAARMAVRVVPGDQEILALPGGQAVGRAKADARDLPRHDRAASPAAHRRAEQGAGACDRAKPHRRLARVEEDTNHGAARRAELQHGQGIGRPRGRDGRRPHRARRTHGRTGRGRIHAAQVARLSLGAHQ